MKRFAQLFSQLDNTTKTNARLHALVEYFKDVNDKDRLWTIALFSHRRPKRIIKTTLLRTWCAEKSNIPYWLFEQSYHTVGDLAETMALLVDNSTSENQKTLSQWIDATETIRSKSVEAQQEFIYQSWDQLNFKERFVFNKLLTGGFRVGVSQKLMTKALAKFEGKDENSLTHRLMGNWTPNDITYEELIRSENLLDDESKPYPFYLAYPLEKEISQLGPFTDWQIEKKWDGIRGQIIKRKDALFVWSRGEELVTHQFPEYHVLLDHLPNGTVIDGEIIAMKDAQVLPFSNLQKRLGRKKPSKKIMESYPIGFIAYDILENEGNDIRTEPLYNRRAQLEIVFEQLKKCIHIQISESLKITSWEDAKVIRSQSRSFLCEGLMIKKKDAPYQSGRKRGDWWKWKIDPLTIDAVMLYAQAGHGRRANLFTDYTFAVWNGNQLVPFTKAYSGLKDEEFKEITSWVRKNTKERFGPVRSVNPELVFEVAFEGIAESTRHKSGIALRFPRMLRWRKDKKAEDANTLDDLKSMLKLYG